MKKLFTLLLPAVLVVSSCTDFEELAQTNDPKPVEMQLHTRSGAAPTFEVLPNPYSLDVMQDIYDDYDGYTELQPTHLYVRFRPQNETQINILRNSGLELFDYPLDVDIPEGVEYVDPTIPKGDLFADKFENTNFIRIFT